MRNALKILPALALTTCPTQKDKDELESSIREEVVDTRFEYAQQVSDMLVAEGLESSALKYGDPNGEISTVLLLENDYAPSATYRVQPYKTTSPRPGDKEKILVVPFGVSAIAYFDDNNKCLVVDGKSETPVEVIEDCTSKLKHN